MLERNIAAVNLKSPLDKSQLLGLGLAFVSLRAFRPAAH